MSSPTQFGLAVQNPVRVQRVVAVSPIGSERALLRHCHKFDHKPPPKALRGGIKTPKGQGNDGSSSEEAGCQPLPPLLTDDAQLDSSWFA